MKKKEILHKIRNRMKKRFFFQREWEQENSNENKDVFCLSLKCWRNKVDFHYQESKGGYLDIISMSTNRKYLSSYIIFFLSFSFYLNINVVYLLISRHFICMSNSFKTFFWERLTQCQRMYKIYSVLKYFSSFFFTFCCWVWDFFFP